MSATLLHSEPVSMPSSIASMMKRSLEPAQYAQFMSVQMFAITYMSEGLRVCGFLALPPAVPQNVYPAIVFNRGGHGPRGALTAESAFAYAGLYASWGYVTIASNYRGHGGSEGTEEWGGNDVSDAMNLLPVLASLGYVDMNRVGIIGGSRGGMMALMMMRRTSAFRAAVTIGAPTALHDLRKDESIRTTVAHFIAKDDSMQSALEQRSAVLWADELSKTTPLLVLHGSGDKRVHPAHAFKLGSALQDSLHPYKLVMYDNADHILAGRRPESAADIRWWMDYYVRDAKALPKVGPHGA
ncbi:MAG: alpha/beta hydrolase family protein [Candidatus Kapaibacterium sp.]|jgi:dipeptidyl aminopeptidase/acylaminoacyl peptidase